MGTRSNSQAAMNRRRKQELTTVGSSRKRSSYMGRGDGARINSLVAAMGVGTIETSLGEEQRLESVTGFEFLRVLVGANQSSGLRCHKKGEIIIFVEAGRITFHSDANGTSPMSAGMVVSATKGEEWSISGGPNGATLVIARSKNYEKGVKQLTEPVEGEIITTEIDTKETLPGTGVPAHTPRRRTKEERAQIAEAAGQTRRLTEEKRSSKEEVEGQSASQILPETGVTLTDPNTGEQVRSLGPQPIGNRLAMQEGQSTGVPLKPEVQKAIDKGKRLSKYAQRQMEIQERIAAGEE